MKDFMNQTKGKNGADFDIRLSELLLNTGITPHLKAYGYLKTAVIMAIGEEDLTGEATERLYRGVAESHFTLPVKVEKAIRHAVEIARIKGTLNNFRTDDEENSEAQSLTDGEFIALLAGRVLIEISEEPIKNEISVKYGNCLTIAELSVRPSGI